MCSSTRAQPLGLNLEASQQLSQVSDHETSPWPFLLACRSWFCGVAVSMPAFRICLTRKVSWVRTPEEPHIPNGTSEWVAKIVE